MGIVLNRMQVRGVRSSRSVGVHLLLDIWGCAEKSLMDEEGVQKVLLDAMKAASVTLLHWHIHRFSPHGVTGFALLKESHISIHTWPELGYAAVDIFSCGKIDPSPVVEVFRNFLQPERMHIRRIIRGKTR